ncbi:MAG: hypothetical protein D6728_02145 [Cyanobacteria bacterium J055]|nr:MAG: hypothetical protein D6728_02145 [Cyanobacteria bacterium J055]
MRNGCKIYCFLASWERSTGFDDRRVPDWLELGVNWQGYRSSTVPWVADVARAIGLLPVEDTLDGWISHLESLGLQEVTPVSCEDFYQDRLYC